MKVVQAMEQDMTIEEQAGDWCTRLALGHLAPEEMAEFDEWLSADRANQEVFDRAQLAWRGLSAIADSPEHMRSRFRSRLI